MGVRRLVLVRDAVNGIAESVSLKHFYAQAHMVFVGVLDVFRIVS